uniref:Sepiapterin reductase a n=1 Tax=Tetraodon nigroviridis TaxID=99883 RepID=H3C318_TETNG
LGRALCVITGASRGFGRALARGLGLLRPPSALVLVARSAAELRAQAELAASEAGRAGLVVRCVVADLAEPEAPGRVVEACQQVFADGMEHVLLVNNAASLGDVSRYARTFTTRAEVDSYMSLNISSCLCLTACVLQAFPQRPGVQRTVVNVSSLCAQQPFSSWVLYCTAKAARDMMFRVLAAEEPELRVLSYAPGPLDTDM